MTKVDPRTYPVMQIKRAQYDKIPRAEDLPEGFLETCEFGFLFRCRGSNNIIGKLVNGNDAIGDQYGTGLSIPKRFVNRYRTRVVPSDSLDSAML